MNRLIQNLQEETERANRKIFSKINYDSTSSKNQAIADLIMADVIDKCHQAANKAETDTTIMTLVEGRDYKSNISYATMRYNLTGPAQLVWNYCVMLGLNPYIQFSILECQTLSFDLCVSWE